MSDNTTGSGERQEGRGFERLVGGEQKRADEGAATLWCIYVAPTAADNLRIGRARGIWGFDQKGKGEGIRQGDHVLIVHQLTDTNPQGGLRVKKAKDFWGTARLIVRGVVTSNLFEDHSEVWPDKTYPYRFRFEQTEERPRVRFDDKEFGLDVVDAVRLSSISGGRAARARAMVGEPPSSSGILESKSGDGRRAWIFQANPEVYDVRGAVRALRQDTWLAMQYKDEIRPGDRVFLWEAGADGGIVGIAEVVEGVSIRPEAAESSAFVKDPVKLGGMQSRVLLRILEALDSILTREEIRSHPDLANLSILRQPQGTNFSITSREAEILEGLLKGRLHPPAPKGANLEALAGSLLLDTDYLARIQKLLEDKGQVIFFGPPGTGKTYVAREFARFLARARGPSEGRVEVVQFHPSYAYEDFVEGYRPRAVDGQPRFELVPGPLKEIVRAAKGNPEGQHVLVVDEINRGNVAKVFGELYYLLEYRNEEIRLQYSEEPFQLPKNLWIIGTMNTADRSIALVDAALRRRFYFVPFFPDEPPIKDILRRWLRKYKPGLIWVADVVDKANERLQDRATAIGPSYFMRANLTEDWVALIWDHAIVPYLAERFFGEEERLEGFTLEKLRETEAE